MNEWTVNGKRRMVKGELRCRPKGPFVRITWPKAQRRARFASRPHPPRADGESDGWLNTHRFRTAQDPIRLERMVNEMRLATEVAAGPIETTPFAPCFRSFPPSARGGWGCGASRDFFSPPSLLTDPGEPDGVAEMLHGPLARHFRLTASRRRRRKRSSDACGLSLNYSRTCFTSLCTVAAIRSSMSPAQRKAGRPYSYRFEPPS